MVINGSHSIDQSINGSHSIDQSTPPYDKDRQGPFLACPCPPTHTQKCVCEVRQRSVATLSLDHSVVACTEWNCRGLSPPISALQYLDR